MSLFPAYASEPESGDAGPPAKIPKQTLVVDLCEDSAGNLKEFALNFYIVMSIYANLVFY